MTMKTESPAPPFHRAVLAAWLRRHVSFRQVNQSGDTVHPESPDYHPAKASKIYHRFCTIIDLYV